MKQEESLQTAVCNYLRSQYPNVLFNTDLSGIRLTIGQAVKVKKMRSGRAWPDLFIAEPRGIYAGLFIELKKEGKKLFKRDLRTPVSEHIAEQIDILMILNSKGYVATFGIGFDEIKKIIDDYLTQR